ncbi:MAG: PilZ domain-containing protein [Candidatus Omnitrophica bacterium]|nr:PilZ domain-containing protein [Candidatus Omnitrophota bacterium]
METVFPVEVEVLKETGEKLSPHFLQGFTRNVSEGGMCVEIKSAGGQTEETLFKPNARLGLTINPSFLRDPVKAVARIAWFQKREDLLPATLLIGAEYLEIDKTAQRRIIHYARQLRWAPRLTLIAGIIVAGFLAAVFYHNQTLIVQNKALVRQLVTSAQNKSEVAGSIYELQKRRAALEAELAKARETIKGLEASLASLTVENQAQKALYEGQIGSVLERQKSIGAELDLIEKDRQKLRTTYEKLKEVEKLTASAALRQMYAWLKSHQNLYTGLVASFEGDPLLEDWAFTYDQSLVCQIFLMFGDVKNAEAILSFYESRAQRGDNGFYNAYDVVDGRIAESTMHVGPNLWLGIAALQYENRVKDGRFLALAKEIGEWTLNFRDAEGGIKGGPGFEWYSTEHNLDAYAFFSMLYRQTGDEKHRAVRDKVLGWIQKYAYSQREKRMNRGKGDATIATDAFSWAVAALGPETLKQMEFDVEAIIGFAEKHCEVAVDYQLPDGKMVKVKGFDFAKAANVGRGGVVSTEWTAQMIVTYRILSGYYRSRGEEEKAVLYEDKINLYLNEIQKLIVTSPSRTGQGRGCLPYASIDHVDTGHGWRTPKGRRTGSLSATAYGIFAWVGYNPFDLENRKEVGS